MRPVISFWRDSLAGRALRFTAATVGLVVVIFTAVSYWVVFQNAGRNRLESLGEYASERAEREDLRFKLANEYHAVLKAAFIKRWNEPDPESLEARFDRHFVRGAPGSSFAGRYFRPGRNLNSNSSRSSHENHPYH